MLSTKPIWTGVEEKNKKQSAHSRIWYAKSRLRDAVSAGNKKSIKPTNGSQPQPSPSIADYEVGEVDDTIQILTENFTLSSTQERLMSKLGTTGYSFYIQVGFLFASSK